MPRTLDLLLFASVLALLAVPSTSLVAQQFVEQTTTRFPIQSEYSSQVAIADVDGDGDLDVAFANGRGFSSAQAQEPVRLYINNGSGVFTDESAARVGISGYGRDVEFGDVNGDGSLDMIVANDFNTAPRLLTNDGTGNFTNVSSTHLPAITLGSSHASFGDVDNNGTLDLWLTNGGTSRFGAGQAQLWLNDGTGHYTNATATHLPAALVSEPMDCVFGDIDGDFDLDMVEGHRASNSRLYVNDGTGHFTNQTAGNLPADSSTYSYDFGDLNGDGHLDLLGANSLPGSSREALFVNNGTGTFSNQTATLLPGVNNPSIDDNDSKFFDFDNDGDLDFVIASLSGSSSERFYRNNNNGASFTLLSGIITNTPDATLDIELGDLDGDGDLDIVTAQGESGNFQNRVYINSGPADTLPPLFPRLEQIADTLDSVGPYVARVVIRDSMTSDHNFFIEDGFLEYSVNGGAFLQVPLWWMGGDLYRGQIPGQPAGSQISYRATARDHNANQGTSGTQIFEVLAVFDRGDCNDDANLDVADAVHLLGYLFPGPGGPSATPCQDACDTNDDGALDISDPIALLGALFPAGPPPGLPAPFGSCGADPTADAIGCTATASCP